MCQCIPTHVFDCETKAGGQIRRWAACRCRASGPNGKIPNLEETPWVSAGGGVADLGSGNRTLEDEFPKWAFSTSRIVGESVLCKPTLKAQRGLLTDSEYESTFGFRLSTVKSCMFPPCCDAWSKHLLCLRLVYACSAHHALDEQSQIHGNSESDSRHRPKVLPSEQLIEPVSH